MRLVFATQNSGKLKEARAIFPSSYTILSLEKFPDCTLPEETADTLDGNALIKARYVYERYKLPCFADDTGLFIDALKGDPGVHSARFAGPNATSEANVQKVLRLLEGQENRLAQFRTVMALIISGKEFRFEGVLEGRITLEPEGESGFGYDPIFKPRGLNRTLASMKPTAKNAISHRRRALVPMVNFLE